ncbi:hypothetical protein L3Q82_003847 [Scortum barcoo]|uniref:Uncharacterized protein n=1 Tax=Scortum barcoo TaxID=214431 RepID=A0ACB8X721_9TELE|nr:hypothetical protein L3Q82_003847 [Scortum barcoo]
MDSSGNCVLLFWFSQHASAVELYEGEEFVLLPCEYQTFNLDDPTVVLETLRSQSSNSPPASAESGTYTCTVRVFGGQRRVNDIQLEVKDIVSDRGPQFVSVFWKEFCHLLGATISLSSGHNPESNSSRAPESRTGDMPEVPGVSKSDNVDPLSFRVNEEEVTVPSAHAMARRCRNVWVAARQMLLRGQDDMKAAADRHRRPAPAYTPGQKVLRGGNCRLVDWTGDIRAKRKDQNLIGAELTTQIQTEKPPVTSINPMDQ